MRTFCLTLLPIFYVPDQSLSRRVRFQFRNKTARLRGVRARWAAPRRGTAALAAGAKRKGHPWFPFLFELLPFLRRAWVQMVDCISVEKGNGRGFLPHGRALRVMYPPIRSIRYLAATHIGYSAQAQHNSVAQLAGLVATDSICEDKLCKTSKFTGARRYNVPKGCATRVSPRGLSLALRAIHLVSRLRSSMLSVKCEKAEKDTLR